MAKRKLSGTSEKREECICWDDYFMAIACLSAQRSKDPRTQVGACIVNENKRIVGTGYNGMPDGLKDDEMPWGKDDEDKLKNKGLYVCHAEMNAILNRFNASLRGCTIYTTLHPCNECTKMIIQSGICKVVYLCDKLHDKPATKASKLMLKKKEGEIETVDYTPKREKIEIDFERMKKTSTVTDEGRKRKQK